MWVLGICVGCIVGIGIDPVIGVVVVALHQACHCHVTTYPICTPQAEGLVVAVEGVVVVGVIVIM